MFFIVRSGATVPMIVSPGELTRPGSRSRQGGCEYFRQSTPFGIHSICDGFALQLINASFSSVFDGTTEQPELVIGLIDVFAISSDSEQMPNSLLQAMASGRPIVATDVGDVADMVAPANRPFVVAKADEAAFSRALLTLAQQPELRECLGTMNRVRAQNIYPEEKMFAAYRRLLAEFFPDLG